MICWTAAFVAKKWLQIASMCPESGRKVEGYASDLLKPTDQWRAGMSVLCKFRAHFPRSLSLN